MQILQNENPLLRHLKFALNEHWGAQGVNISLLCHVHARKWHLVKVYCWTTIWPKGNKRFLESWGSVLINIFFLRQKITYGKHCQSWWHMTEDEKKTEPNGKPVILQIYVSFHTGGVLYTTLWLLTPIETYFNTRPTWIQGNYSIHMTSWHLFPAMIFYFHLAATEIKK